jgi:hypothetical protein
MAFTVPVVCEAPCRVSPRGRTTIVRGDTVCDYPQDHRLSRVLWRDARFRSAARHITCEVVRWLLMHMTLDVDSPMRAWI